MADLAMRSLAAVPMRHEDALGMVEIVVLKWRQPDLEVRCLEQIVRHTDWPYKLVVYDNRPNTPNTARIWNKLIRAATCPYVCVIDSDAFVPAYPTCWLTRMMQTFAQYPDCRLVAPVTNRCSTPAQKAAGPDVHGLAVRHDGEWSGFCFLLRPELLTDVGPFDEEFVGYGQDSEFAVRLARRGGGAYIRRDVWVEHVHGASFADATRLGLHDAAADRAYAARLFREKTRCG
jgi:hypothetical protein